LSEKPGFQTLTENCR